MIIGRHRSSTNSGTSSTFAPEQLVVTALLEPYVSITGDAYNYSVNISDAYLAVFDGRPRRAGRSEQATEFSAPIGLWSCRTRVPAGRKT
jgi:hypothetical protein